MAFTIPTLASWRTQARNALAARLSTVATLRFSVANVLADVFAGFAYTILQYFQNQAVELFIGTMDGDYLDSRGAIYTMPREPSAPAAGTVTFTGTNGYTIPNATALLAADQVTGFTTQAAGTIASSSVTVPVLATTYGSVGNLAAGATVSLVTAIAGVNPSATVAGSGFTGGLDEESDAAYRGRLLARQSYPPHGGAWFDYVAWAKAAGIGVTRAWVCFQYTGAGTVGVAFTIDTRSNPIPLSGDLTNVKNYIAPLAPIDVPQITVFAPTAAPVPVTITNLVPDTAIVTAGITTALQQLFATQPTPGGATWGDGVDTNDPAGHTALSQIYGAIANAPGVISFDLTAPTADIVQSSGTISTLGTLTIT